MTSGYKATYVLTILTEFNGAAYGLRTPNEGLNQRYLKLHICRCGRQNMLRIQILFWLCSEGGVRSPRLVLQQKTHENSKWVMERSLRMYYGS